MSNIFKRYRMKTLKPLAALLAAFCLFASGGCSNGESRSSGTEEKPDASTDRSDSYGETAENNPPQISDTSEYPTFAPPEENFPFPGLELTGETLTVGNLSANAKEMSTNAFFCCDEDGEIYYADLTDGGYLYHLNDGKPEKLADLPASWITAVEDDIFFISPTGTITSEIGDSAPTGTVYRYSKTEKRSEVYLDENNIKCLHATADGLYYGTREEWVYESGTGTAAVAEYFRGFQSDASEKQPMNYWLETCGYHLEHSEERNTFFMTNGSVSADIAADDTMLFVNGCIVDKKNYAFFRKTFRILNLQTSGMRVYTADDFSSLLAARAPRSADIRCLTAARIFASPAVISLRSTKTARFLPFPAAIKVCLSVRCTRTAQICTDLRAAISLKLFSPTTICFRY